MTSKAGCLLLDKLNQIRNNCLTTADLCCGWTVLTKPTMLSLDGGQCYQPLRQPVLGLLLLYIMVHMAIWVQ